MLRMQKVKVDDIYVPAARRKTLHPETVRHLAEDILENGMETTSMAGDARIRPPASLPEENARPFGLAEEETVAFPAPDLPDSVEPPVEPAALMFPTRESRHR